MLLDTVSWTAAKQWLLPGSLAGMGFLPLPEGECLTTAHAVLTPAGGSIGASGADGLYTALQLRLYAAMVNDMPVQLQVHVLVGGKGRELETNRCWCMRG